MITISIYSILSFICCVGLVLISINLGYRLGAKKQERDRAGSFIINYDDPTKELMTLRLDKDLPEIEEENYILLQVIIERSSEPNLENSPE